MTTTKHIKGYEQLKVLSVNLISEIPEVMTGFGPLHSSAVATDALDTKS
jgi:hypothetical protein|tara:strand:- start:173 stop:319 length:147 start_codon:yes stop_codon:yes gene_type:complete